MATVTKLANGRYQARWRTPEGGSRKKTFAKKSTALAEVTRHEHSKSVGGYVDPSAGRQRFKLFAAQWLEAQTFDESTREAVASRLRAHLNPTFGELELRAIRPSTVQGWLRGRQVECAPRYVRVMLANLSAILGAAVDDGRIVTNPCGSRSVHAPAVEQHRIEPWPIERVEAVIAAHPEAYRALPVLAAGAGLRQGEAFGLRVADIDFLRHRLLVRQQVKMVGGQLVLAPPKGRKAREVPLADTVAVALAERLRLFPPGPDGLVFTSRESKLLNRTHYNPYVWKPALRTAGVEPTRANGMHALRHFYASVLLDAGESIRALADYLGHTDPGFTLRVYTHLIPASEARSRRAIDGAFGASRVRAVSAAASTP
jgi:integrase